MARSSIEERLARLEEQKRQLEEQARSLRSRMSEDRRKLETRQRILLGAFLGHHLARKNASVDPIRRWVAKELPGFLTKSRDRDVMAEVLDALGRGQPVPESALEVDGMETGGDAREGDDGRDDARGSGASLNGDGNHEA